MFKNIFYPKGKVHKNYIKYIGWSFVSNTFLSIETAISTHSMLHAVSGKNEISSINYIGKDIIGQIGSLVYIVNHSDSIDNQTKKFLFQANILQQTSYFLMSMTPLYSSQFLLIAGTSNILSNMSFISYGAVNAKYITKLALDNNIGEIYSKLTIINSLGSSLGLLMGLGITILIPSHEERLCLIPILGFLRIYSFNLALKNIQ